MNAATIGKNGPSLLNAIAGGVFMSPLCQVRPGRSQCSRGAVTMESRALPNAGAQFEDVVPGVGVLTRGAPTQRAIECIRANGGIRRRG